MYFECLPFRLAVMYKYAKPWVNYIAFCSFSLAVFFFLSFFFHLLFFFFTCFNRVQYALISPKWIRSQIFMQKILMSVCNQELPEMGWMNISEIKDYGFPLVRGFCILDQHDKYPGHIKAINRHSHLLCLGSKPRNMLMCRFHCLKVCC